MLNYLGIVFKITSSFRLRSLILASTAVILPSSNEFTPLILPSSDEFASLIFPSSDVILPSSYPNLPFNDLLIVSSIDLLFSVALVSTIYCFLLTLYAFIKLPIHKSYPAFPIFIVFILKSRVAQSNAFQKRLLIKPEHH